MIAVNVMRAVSEYAAYVRQSCASGADAIVVGAGLPLDLPELAAPYPDVALIPILSDARGIQLVVKKWARKGRLPDAIVIEHPRYAGGHLGAAKIEDLADPRFDFERVLPDVLAFFRAEGIADGAIPLIPAGGINTHERIRELIALGASGGADRHRLRGYRGGRRRHRVQARAGRRRAPQDIVEFMSVAGLARARRAHAVARDLSQVPAEARRRPRTRSRAARSSSTACSSAGCATASRRSASSASTCSSRRRSRATSRRGCSSAARRRFRSAAEIRPVRDLIDLSADRRSAAWQPRRRR